MRCICSILLLLAVASTSLGQDDSEQALVRTALCESNLAQGRAMLEAHLVEHPEAGDAIRFGIGMAHFFESGERLAAALYRHGAFRERQLWNSIRLVPFDISQIPQAIDPDPITYEQMDAILQRWLDDLAAADAALAQVTQDDVRLDLPIGLIRLDIDGDGRGSEGEALWNLFARLQRRFDATAEGAEEFTIAFDRADVSWLRGYCRFLMAVGEFVLAHDRRELFDRCAQILFARPETPYPYLAWGEFDDEMPWQVADMVAFIHLMNFEVIEPQRLVRSLQHLEQGVVMGREMWTHLDAETDNHREWIPNPKQQSVLAGAEMTEEIRETWLMFLDEAELVLRGERLLRFWRMATWMNQQQGTGINLRRVFLEPQRFDLLLWVQGSAAKPYLEEGTLTEPKLWERMDEVFDGRVFRWGFWLN